MSEKNDETIDLLIDIMSELETVENQLRTLRERAEALSCKLH